MISAKEKAEQDAGAEREYIWQAGRAAGEAEGKALGLTEGGALREAKLISIMVSKGKSAKEIAELFDMDEDKVKMMIK